jgi:anti-anti-sigma factor
VTTTAFHHEPLPPPAPFAVTVEEAHGQVQVQVRVHVVGELDAWTAPSLVDALTAVTDPAGIPAQSLHQVELDLSQLSFLDTAGLSALSDSRLALQAVGWRLHLVRAQPNVSRLLAYAVESGWLPGDLVDQAG